jgi:UrcA family protein
MMKPLSAIAAVLFSTALLTPTVSHADDARSATISYADLNLANDQGRSALQGRIATAAGQVCNVGASHREIALAQFSQRCRSDAIASAQPALDAAINAARRGTVTVLTGATLTVSAQ